MAHLVHEMNQKVHYCNCILYGREYDADGTVLSKPVAVVAFNYADYYDSIKFRFYPIIKMSGCVLSFYPCIAFSDSDIFAFSYECNNIQDFKDEIKNVYDNSHIVPESFTYDIKMSIIVNNFFSATIVHSENPGEELIVIRDHTGTNRITTFGVKPPIYDVIHDKNSFYALKELGYIKHIKNQKCFNVSFVQKNDSDEPTLIILLSPEDHKYLKDEMDVIFMPDSSSVVYLEKLKKEI